MPIDGFTLSFAVRELNEALCGGRVDKATQPEPDAALLLIRGKGENHRLLLSASANYARAQLTSLRMENPAEPPMFCMLLRKHLQGARLLEIAQIAGDRVLRFSFECLDELNETRHRALVLEMMGKHSNLIFVEDDGRVIDAIRHVSPSMSRVRTVLPGSRYQDAPAQDKLPPDRWQADAIAERLLGGRGAADRALAGVMSGLSAVTARELCLRACGEESPELAGMDVPAFAAGVVSAVASLRADASPCVLLDGLGEPRDFFAAPYRLFPASSLRAYPTLGAAMDAFYRDRDLRARMKQRSQTLAHTIRTHLSRAEKKREALQATLRDCEDMERLRVSGELLTAQLHAIPKGAARVTLENYYDENGGTTDIALNPALSPAQNAQAYFKRYRKACVARTEAAKQLEKTAADAAFLEEALLDIDNCRTGADISEMRRMLADAGYIRRESAAKAPRKPPENAPFRFAAPDGTEVLVGKNALQNDRLTLSARPNDTWLHAQGVAGSHVIARVPDGGREPSEAALEHAAKAAAWFSTARDLTVIPVDCTLRKYVRKGAGAPAGFVTYTHHRTFLIRLTDAERAAFQRG